MGVTDYFAGEIATELLKLVIQISRKSLLCKSSAESLMNSINELGPIIREIKYSGVELPAIRQSQLDRLSETLRDGVEVAKKVVNSNRWNVYKNLHLARKMEKLEKKISAFVNGTMHAHILADVHHMRFESTERFDRTDWSLRRLEQKIDDMKIGVGGGRLVEEAVSRVEMAEKFESLCSEELFGTGMEVAKRKVKEMMIGSENFGVVGICGMGGSGKTTLANEICRDHDVQSQFKNRILKLTVSQSPNVEQLRAKILGFIAEISVNGSFHDHITPTWNKPFEGRVGARMLIVLDDVWSTSVLEQLIFRVAGCKTLVVSRFRFPQVVRTVYEVELLRDDEAIFLFCHYAFGQRSIPLAADSKLVKQIVNECKGLPLALKVIGASLRDQHEMFWASANKRLSRGETICESHENKLLDRMAISVGFLPKKVRECFLDLGCFPEDKKIPLDVLTNIWIELHGLGVEEAFAILDELSNKNLLTLVKDSRGGDQYSSYYDISVTQHDVLRDLAIHLGNNENTNAAKRLLMPRRETELPKEWERAADQPFNAQIVSVHTGEMRGMEWFRMEFPKAEVLILNFSANEYFLPPFVDDMPKLRAVIAINSGPHIAKLQNLLVFSDMAHLRSLWLEKVSIAQFSECTAPLKNLRKLSLVLCKLEGFVINLTQMFPSLQELTIDHCDDLVELPSSICQIHSLKTLSITNCHNLHQLPENLGDVKWLLILRLYACPALPVLPARMCELCRLNYLDISQCVNLKGLPEKIGELSSLEKIDMRECSQIWSLPKSAASLESLRIVICDEEVSWLWKDMKTNVHVQVAEKGFSLDWLDE
ncbi:hypothetical protein K2173_028063 [Erythroxylum novogranatense]|uniref:RPW8 domain-containing protein n=1 Tax=Erythroxylum novogranatense TaxID=1862640 RepID=A0AAV8U0T6_9ROSI|nr:hypothetical protein K2173_028063 [Erythroxylum novogranatense]